MRKKQTEAWQYNAYFFCIALGAMATASLVLNLNVRQFQLDDAGITWRYIWNITHGLGWVYNAGEHVNAATSPLRTILLALLSLITGDIPRTSLIFDTVCLAGAAVVLALWLRQQGHTLAGVVAGLLLATHPLLSFSIGVETALVLLLVGLALWAYGAAHYHTMTILLALLTLARNDGVLLIGCLFAYHSIQQWRGQTRRLPWTIYPLGIALLAPWFFYSWYTFGSPVPNTLAAKTAQGSSGYFPTFGAGWLDYLRLFDAWRIATLTLFLAPIGVRFALHKRMTFLIPVVTFGFLHFAVYLALGVAAYPWYYAPFLYGALILSSIGIEALATGCTSLFARYTVGYRCVALAALPITLIVGALLWSQIVASNGHELTLRVIERSYDNSRNYNAVSTYLRAHATPGTTVAASEIGLIGWETQLPIVDYLGLLSTDTAERVRHGDVTSWVDTFSPDYIIMHNPAWLMESPWRLAPSFRDSYIPVATIAENENGTVIIWQRRVNVVIPHASGVE